MGDLLDLSIAPEPLMSIVLRTLASDPNSI